VVIDHALGQHSTAAPEPLANKPGVLFEMFDHHEQHGESVSNLVATSKRS
jgi:hypothetical protein